MNNNILNITNGDSFNGHFLLNFGGKAVTFCEDMMDGNTVPDIFSREFINIRSKELNVSTKEYRSKMHVYDALNENVYSELRLWFGKDTFCQVNLLTLLAYLEQIGFAGKVVLNYIDDETFEVVEENIDVKLGLYRKLYKDILISKQTEDEAGVLVAGAIDLYFDYHSDNGTLARMVMENSHMDRTALICLLLKNSKAYGLSDLQAEKLIDHNLTKETTNGKKLDYNV